MNDVGRFLNRILGLAPEIQNRYATCEFKNNFLLAVGVMISIKNIMNHRLFEVFVSILDLLVQNARIEGNLDSGIVDMKANSVELQGKPKVNTS